MDGPSASTGPDRDSPWLLGPRRADQRAKPSDGGDQPSGLPADTLGLALSGEGVRGAAFGLGVLQAMARAGWLRHVDYLSTVAGGGYTGAFLGRYFDSYRMRRGEPGPSPGMVQDRVGGGLIDPDSAPVDWLRRHSNHLAPGGVGDAVQKLVGYLRSLLAFYLVLGALFLAVFGAVDAVGYLGDHAVGRGGVFGGPRWSLQPLIADLSPIGQSLPAGWRGPWLAVAEWALWLAVVPLMLAYWLASQDLPESFVAPVLIAAAIVAGAALFLAGGSLALIVLVVSVLWTLASWAAARREEGPQDERHPHRRTMAREHLNRRLTFWVALTVALAAAWVIDRVGRWLAVMLSARAPSLGAAVWWLGAAGVVVLALTVILGAAARALASVRSRTGQPAPAGWALLWPVAALVFGALPLAMATSFVGHTMYGGGEEYARGLTITVVAAILSLLFGSRECLPLINRSGFFSIQAGRLARTFFGAVNPARRAHPEGRDITRPVAGDDVPFDQYQPESVGGPLHLINCAVHETFDVASFQITWDRGAENLAVGPAGVSVAQTWHALWTDRGTAPRLLRPLGTEAPDPFLGRGAGPVRVEPLGLEDWVAISGATLDASEARRAHHVQAPWRALSGLRSGYWWDSGLDAGERTDRPIRGGLLTAFGASLARLFRGQTLLLSELTGRFGGPWTRHWYLSSGAVFESTGAYELLRRRLPFIIVCDAGADPERRGAALARLVRLARVDLGAEVTEIGPGHEAFEKLGAPTEIANHLGSLADLLTSPNTPSRHHAALLLFRHPEPPRGSAGDPYLARRESWVLYIKTTYNGDEPIDIRAYAAAHADFPDDGTTDANFDEQQWESYRLLGEHIGACVFNKVAAP